MHPLPTFPRPTISRSIRFHRTIHRPPGTRPPRATIRQPLPTRTPSSFIPQKAATREPSPGSRTAARQVSAHYVVSYDGAHHAVVRENQKAWHVSCANSYCSIGIEHEGFASASSHPTAQYNASGDLTHEHLRPTGASQAEAHRSGPGIIGHIDMTHCCCGTHTDPGNGWDWTYYINQRGRRAPPPPPPPAFDATYNAQSFPSSMTAGSNRDRMGGVRQ